MTDTPDTSREAVERYSQGLNGNMYLDDIGPWVGSIDYADLLARAEKAEAENGIGVVHFEAVSSSRASAIVRLNQMRAERDALQAEVDRLRAAQAWQPIETAPKDGTWFVIWTHGEPEVGRYNPVKSAKYEPVDGTDFYKKSEFCVYDWDGFNNFGNASHWMPLPTPPTP